MAPRRCRFIRRHFRPPSFVPCIAIKEHPQVLAGTSSKLRPRHVYASCLNVLPLLAATIGQQPQQPQLAAVATSSGPGHEAAASAAVGDQPSLATADGHDALATSLSSTAGSPPTATTTTAAATTTPAATGFSIDRLLAGVTITPLAAVPLPPPLAGTASSFSALMAPGFPFAPNTTDASASAASPAVPPAPLLPTAPITSLQSLQARNLHLPLATLPNMCLALFADSTIVDLRLVNCNLTVAHLQILVNQISALSHIRCLYIDHNPLLSGGSATLPSTSLSSSASSSPSQSSSLDVSLWTQLVTSNPTLVLLSARGCSLADPVVTAIATGIKSHMCGLRVLCLARNKITRVGVEALADALLPRGPAAISSNMGTTPSVVVVGAQGPPPTLAITPTASVAPPALPSMTSPTPAMIPTNTSMLPSLPVSSTTTHTPPLISLSLASNALTDESAFALARVLGKQPLTQDDAAMRKKFFTELERLKVVEEEALLAQEMAGAATAGGKKAKAGAGAGGAGGAGKPGTARGGSAEERQAAGAKGGKGTAAAGAASPSKGGAAAGAAGAKGAGGLSAANANPAAGGKPPGSAVDVKGSGGGPSAKKGSAAAPASGAAAKKGGAPGAGGKGKGGAGADADASVEEGTSSANLDANGEPLEVISVPPGIDLDMFEQGGGYFLWGNRTLAHINLSMNRLSVNAVKMFADAIADQMVTDKNLITSNMYATDPGLKERSKHGLLTVNLERNLFPTDDNTAVSELHTAFEKKLAMFSAPSSSNVPTPSASSRIQSAVKR
ncbi:hypothetical protein BCR44DRAFT_1253604 [Catenaria anguillulae PL171]|uniref:Uncharacterized protein n=1 Tax=Catenaria anguillulae PL171 TaxID=765915 RepID=A0A1Y2HDV8_9FUNG|nr:hypothetical protein BCR44DRAFT_1253604 [Catenaria anguillulae PL171]